MLRRIARAMIILAGALAALAAGGILAVGRLDPPITPLMAIRAAESLAAGRRPHMAHRPIPLAAVSPHLLQAVIAGEDERFPTHHGIDWDAIARARDHNRRHPDRLRGASTITMQCARNVFLWPARQWLRKGIEAALATAIEMAWGKRRILEVYLNVVEWGPGVYGAEAAARHWFSVPAAALDARQAALLAAMLPAPRTENPLAPSSRLRARATVIARRAGAVQLDRLGAGGEPAAP